ncbi:hypothetical protein [Pyruvatibacter sp.]
MALETAQYVAGLNPANPLSDDGLSQGDDHLRLIKSTLASTFPNLDGAVTASPAALNSASFVGEIRLYAGDPVNLPAGWHVCDGENGTVDLVDKFPVGAGGLYALLATGGSITSSLTTDPDGGHDHGGETAGHGLTSAENGPHTHSYTKRSQWVANTSDYVTGSAHAWFQETGGTTGSSGSGTPHTHGIGTDGVHTHTADIDTTPPYVALHFVQRTS